MPDYSKTRIQLRRGTAAELAAANPTLGLGEPAFETDTNTLKIGDGSTAYSSLSAISGGGGGGSSTFVGLSDTPANFTSAGSKFLKVNSGASALEFVAVSPLENVEDDPNPQLGGELNLNNKDIVIDAKNNDGTQLDAGTPVYIVDYHAGSSKPLIAPADASDSTKMPAIGITNDDIAGNAEGTVGVMGIIDGIDTTSPVSFNLGDVVYVANGGGLTNVKPTAAAHLIQNLGRVTKINASNGRILLLGAGRVNDIPNSGTFSGGIEAASLDVNGQLRADDIIELNNTNFATGTHAGIKNLATGPAGLSFVTQNGTPSNANLALLPTFYSNAGITMGTDFAVSATHALTMAFDKYASDGDAQTVKQIAHCVTTDGSTTKELTTNNDSVAVGYNAGTTNSTGINIFSIPFARTATFILKLTGHNQTDGSSACYIYRGAARNNAASAGANVSTESMALVGTMIEESFVDSGMSGVSVTVAATSADDRNTGFNDQYGRLSVKVVGLNSKTIHWVASFDATFSK